MSATKARRGWSASIPPRWLRNRPGTTFCTEGRCGHISAHACKSRTGSIYGGPHCLDQKMAILRYFSSGHLGPDTIASHDLCSCPCERAASCDILTLPGETEASSAGAQLTKG